MNNILNNLSHKIKNPKFLVIIGLVGILLIFLSSFTNQDKNTTKNTEHTDFSYEEYRIQLEKDIGKIVKSITGSRNVTVVVTLESGIKYKYADITEGSSADKTENDVSSSSSEIKQGYITIKTENGGEEALFITAQMPEIRGVAIVCPGGDNNIIAEKIKNTVTAALNITSKRIYIAGGS